MATKNSVKTSAKKTTKRNKQRSSKSFTAWLRRHDKIFIVILIVAGVTGLGYSYVKFVRAVDTTPGSLYVDYPENVISHDVGTTFTLTVNGNMPNMPASELGGSGAFHLDIDISYMSNVTVTGLTTLAGTNKGGYTGVAASGGWIDGPATCIQYSSSMLGQYHVPLFRLTFKQNTAGTDTNPYNWGFNVKWRGGSCPNPPDDYFGYSYIDYSLGFLGGNCGATGQLCGGGGPGGGTTTPGGGGGGGTSNPGTDGGGGSGGGSGGSTGGPSGQGPQPSSNQTTTKSSTSRPAPSATKQNNQPQSVPKTSPQGDQKPQTAIEPSPFYDGKLYSAGSDAEYKSSLVSSSLAREFIVNNWKQWIAPMAVLIGGGIALSIWRRKRS